MFITLVLLLTIPFVVFSKPNEAEILVFTTEKDGTSLQNEYASAIQTFTRYEIPYHIVPISRNGITDEQLNQQLFSYSDGKAIPKYKVLVFPNGRISYDHADYSKSSKSDWQSAIKYDQWEILYDYSRNYDARLVFLNEYPSNYTSTELAHESIDEEIARQSYQLKQTITAEKGVTEENTINSSGFTTEGIYHFQAKIKDYGNGITAKPLLYFSECSGFPDKSVAAVTVNNKGAKYVAFFMAFGEWSSTSSVLNIIWLTWATQKDLKYSSNKDVTTQQAINEIRDSYNGVGKATKAEFLLIILSTITAIIFNVL